MKSDYDRATSNVSKLISKFEAGNGSDADLAEKIGLSYRDELNKPGLAVKYLELSNAIKPQWRTYDRIARLYSDKLSDMYRAVETLDDYLSHGVPKERMKRRRSFLMKEWENKENLYSVEPKYSLAYQTAERYKYLGDPNKRGEWLEKALSHRWLKGPLLQLALLKRDDLNDDSGARNLFIKCFETEKSLDAAISIGNQSERLEDYTTAEDWFITAENLAEEGYKHRHLSLSEVQSYLDSKLSKLADYRQNDGVVTHGGDPVGYKNKPS